MPTDLEQTWIKWQYELSGLQNFTIDRCLAPADFGTIASFQLHHFSAACPKGYCAVSYIRLTNISQQVHCVFVLGKSRLAPLKTMTIPRLKLSAAVLAVKMDHLLRSELDITIDRSYFWTDSMIVLQYIQSETKRFHTFVANRVVLIHTASSIDQWDHVSTT